MKNKKEDKVKYAVEQLLKAYKIYDYKCINFLWTRWIRKEKGHIWLGERFNDENEFMIEFDKKEDFERALNMLKKKKITLIDYEFFNI